MTGIASFKGAEGREGRWASLPSPFPSWNREPSVGDGGTVRDSRGGREETRR